MNNNNNNNKMNIVTKTFTNLPDEVCNIIYEYYKLPFIDEIQNPFNIYTLKSDCPFLIERNLNRFCYDDLPINNYKLDHDKLRTTIFGKQPSVYSQYHNEFYFPVVYSTIKSTSRFNLKKLCRENGIEITDRTQTKTLIKRLMKL